MAVPSKPRKPHITIRAVVRKGEGRGMQFDYKDVATLSRFLTEHGSIMSRERSGLPNKEQRALSQAIKRARHVALLPFVTTL